MMIYFKKIVEWKLRFFAKLVLKKYQPKVIGVTGSVGKTSTKEAIYSVLSSKYKVWKNVKNYNTEFGVPLSILGMESGYRNPFSWIGIFLKASSLLIFRKKNYPEYLILEMGADKPGDIKNLVEYVKCRVGVITAIGEVHTELFENLEKVISEKQRIISHLGVNDFAVLNVDDQDVLKTVEKTRAKVVGFGFSDEADVKATEIDVSSGPSADPWIDVQVKGVSFKLQYKGATVPVFLPSVLGEHQVYSALAAAAVGVSFGMNLSEIAEALKNFKSPAGRMRLIKGIKHTSIIDDSYNSSPMAAKAALKLMKKVNVSGKKFAALGDMLELGKLTVRGHKEVGRLAAESVDVLVTVGERSKYIAEGAKEAGMSENNIFSFGVVDLAGRFIQQRLKKGDIVLIKGSQGARMEKVTKELMAEPLKAEQLLVRQGPKWK